MAGIKSRPKPTKPRYRHDCDTCQFLGRYEYGRVWYDLYFCPRPSSGTVVARYKSNGLDYMSLEITVLLYAGQQWDSPLVEGARRQIQRWIAIAEGAK